MVAHFQTPDRWVKSACRQPLRWDQVNAGLNRIGYAHPVGEATTVSEFVATKDLRNAWC